MKDAFHGSARPALGLDGAVLTPHPAIVRPYRGSTKQRPLRGTARTSPTWIRATLAAYHVTTRVPAIVLDLEQSATKVPCWTGRAQRWVRHTVPTAYRLRYDTHVRPAMPNNPISLKTLVVVAEARAGFADHRTGRNCRPTNARLAELTGLSVRTVQRASTALRLLGVATEVLRGRQRTRTERYASWAAGDKGRGWASVWALHDSRFTMLSPHPGGCFSTSVNSSKKLLTTSHRQKTAGRRGAGRRECRDTAALTLANRWMVDQQTPAWARRYRTGTPWAAVLRGPAAHGWTPRDINQMLTDWIGTGHWLPQEPHKPIGLLAAVLAWHGNLEERPAAADEAREAQELAQARERVRRQIAERARHAQARAEAQTALTGAGRAAAIAAAAAIANRVRRRELGGAR